MDKSGNMNSINLMSLGIVERPNSTLRSPFGLQTMTPMTDRSYPGSADIFRGTSSLMNSTNGASYNPLIFGNISELWDRERAKHFDALSGSQPHVYYPPNYDATYAGIPPPHPLQTYQPISLSNNGNVGPHKEDVFEEISNSGIGPGVSDGQAVKKRDAFLPESPQKEKKAKTRAPRLAKEDLLPLANRTIRPPKKRTELVINGINMDISGIPIPICSCTGVPQQCYRWGQGGWQSACCTTNMSTYPLPMSTKRRGARIAGRKMSIGAFKKVLEKLSSEGYNFTDPIDLRNYWAKHGTNKFVTIR